MFCPQCGTETNPAAKFCHACGQPLEGAPQPVSAPPIPTEAAQNAPPVVEAPGLPELETHPSRRFFARAVDMLLVVPLLYLFFFNRFGDHYSFSEVLIGTDDTRSLLENPIVIGVILFLLWIPLEAACLATFGATVGKFAFGIRVIGADGNRLSYRTAFVRSIGVFSYGVAFGLPILNLITGAIAHHRLKKTGTTRWDEKAKSSVRFIPWAPIGMAICAFVILLALITFVLTPLVVAKVKGIYSAGTGERQPTTSQSTGPAQPNASESPAQKPIVDLEEKRKIEVAAAQGDPVAQYQLGKIYLKEKNFEEAARWVRLSADQGYAVAQDKMGHLYYGGRAVPKDPKEAVRLFRLAAKQGVGDSNDGLGWAYKQGEGLPQDDKLSLYHFGLGADQGSTAALSSLAGSYDHSFVGKYYTLSKAEARETVVAYALLNLMCSKSCDDSSKQERERVRIYLDDKQIEVGQALTRQMQQEKPTKVIERYLKTGSVGK